MDELDKLITWLATFRKQVYINDMRNFSWEYCPGVGKRMPKFILTGINISEVWIGEKRDYMSAITDLDEYEKYILYIDDYVFVYGHVLFGSIRDVASIWVFYHPLEKNYE